MPNRMTRHEVFCQMVRDFNGTFDAVNIDSQLSNFPSVEGNAFNFGIVWKGKNHWNVVTYGPIRDGGVYDFSQYVCWAS